MGLFSVNKVKECSNCYGHNYLSGVVSNKSVNSVTLKKSKNSSIFNNPVIKVGEELVSHPMKNESFVISQGRLEQWCADTVNYLYEKAYGKNPFGTDKNGKYLITDVNGLKDWGIKHGRFIPVNTPMQVKTQLNSMHSGDIIIFKSPYTVKVAGGQKITRHASHTGIIKSVKNGIVTTIEGNANIYKTNSKGERLIVRNFQQGINGNQAIGDFQEVNRYDKVIEKQYDVNALRDNGYSGYINMKKAIK